MKESEAHGETEESSNCEDQTPEPLGLKGGRLGPLLHLTIYRLRGVATMLRG